MKKTLKSILILVTLIILLLIYTINSVELINNIIDYSILFLTKLFPVSFIFFIMSNLLINYGLLEIIYKYFHINSSKLYIFIISLISGFPSGAKYTSVLLNKNIINSYEANQIIKFSHFPNPLFVLGSVGTILDSKYTYIILLSLVLSNLIIFLCSSKYKSKIELNNNYNIMDFSSILSNSIKDAFLTIVLIYGISLFFYLISSFITKYFYFNSYIYILINGMFDLTQGVFSTSLISDNLIRSLFIIVFISFGSISIHMQVRGIISNTSISYTSFVKGRIIGTILALVIFIIMRMGMY